MSEYCKALLARTTVMDDNLRCVFVALRPVCCLSAVVYLYAVDGRRRRDLRRLGLAEQLVVSNSNSTRASRIHAATTHCF